MKVLIFAFNYGIGLTSILSSAIILFLIKSIYDSLGIKGQPLVVFIANHCLLYFSLTGAIFLLSVGTSFINGNKYRFFTIAISNMLAFSLTMLMALSATPLFQLIETLGKEGDGAGTFPFPGFNFALPIFAFSLMLPFHIFSFRSLKTGTV